MANAGRASRLVILCRWLIDTSAVGQILTPDPNILAPARGWVLESFPGQSAAARRTALSKGGFALYLIADRASSLAFAPIMIICRV